MFKISHNKPKHVCKAYRCKSPSVSRKGYLCHKHYARKIRERDPVYARYNQFCCKARSRGIENTVTLPQFRHFCKREGYIVVKGRRGQNATIDRRCNTHGYHWWNMQILHTRVNASKGNKHSGDNFECPF